MSSTYYNMLDSTGESGFLPTVTFDGSSSGFFTSAHRTNTLSSIGITGFYEADFSNTVTTIDLSAFAMDTKVVVATINGVRSIRSDAFYGCTALRAITLDCSVNTSTKQYLLTDISSGAFQGCTSLRNLHIPDTVKIIPDNMCNGCTGLEVAVMGYGWDRTDNSYNTTGRIGRSAFANCSKLPYFIVPETVGGINDSAFANDVSLSLVYLLGTPDVSANAFTGAMGAGAIYYYNSSKDVSGTFPAGSTKRAYQEVTITATNTLTYGIVATAIASVSSYWKAKILTTVSTLDTVCFSYGYIGAKFSNLIGLSFPATLNVIGYGAFLNTDANGANPQACNIGAYYFPNKTYSFPNINNTYYQFNLINAAGHNASSVRQFVFQSGVNTFALPAGNIFTFTTARAMIMPNVTSIRGECFGSAYKMQFFSFFQKNAYTELTYLGGDTEYPFNVCFTTGIAGYRHYIYIPKQITHIGVGAFPNITEKLVVTAYNNTINSAGVTQAIGLGTAGYFNWSSAGNGYLSNRFHGTIAPTILLINNYYDSAGLTSGAANTSNFGTGFPYHVLFPSQVKTITNRFGTSTNLKTVTIPDTVTDLSLNAFLSCTGLTNVYISPKSNLTIIGENSINTCTSLTSLFIPNSVKRIELNAFNGCIGLATVTFGDNPSLKYIGPQAFYGTTKALTSIFIPSSVVYIGYRAFIAQGTDVNILNTVTFGAGSRLKSIDYKCFGNDGNNISYSAQYLRDLVLPNTLRYMGSILNTTSSPLQNTHRLAHSANLVVPSSLEVIPWAFLFADSLTVDISNVYFPRSITNVAGPRKHNGYSVNSASISTGLAGAEFYLSRAGSLIYLPSELSAYTGYTGFPFPNNTGTEAAGRTRSYYKTVSYTSNIGTSLTTLGLGASVANTTNATTTSQIHADIQEGVTVIGGGTKNITSATGDGSLNLISVNIPSTVTDISAYAFNGCSALAYVTFSENSHLTTIGNSAFLGCSLIPDIQLPDTLTTIGPNAFSGCNNLASISIPYNVTSIGSNAFAGTFVRTRYVRLHQKLYNDISGSLSTYFPGVSASSFQVIPALTLTNTLNPSRLTISQINNMYIRYRQSQLGGCTFITVSASAGGMLTPADVTTALASSTGLVHLDFGSNVTDISKNVCNANTRIYSVAISKTVTSIGQSAFYDCTNLTYLSFHPDSTCTNLGNGAFSKNNIMDLALPDSLTTIEGTFANSYCLTSVCIPKNVTYLDTAFINCPKLTSVALPSSLTTCANGSNFSTNPAGTAPSTFSYYSAGSAIPHFKLSDYSMPNGIVQTVIDSAVTYIDHLAYAYYPDITLYAVTTNKQTQTPGQYSYTVNNVQTPIMPAAFLLNGGSFVSNSMFPIYRSIPDLNVFTGSSTNAVWTDDQDDYYILMPGYSICIYNNLYDEENLFTDSPTYRYYDNEFGKVPLNITINVPNTTSSILIMFNGRILSKYFAS